MSYEPFIVIAESLIDKVSDVECPRIIIHLRHDAYALGAVRRIVRRKRCLEMYAIKEPSESMLQVLLTPSKNEHNQSPSGF